MGLNLNNLYKNTIIWRCQADLVKNLKRSEVSEATEQFQLSRLNLLKNGNFVHYHPDIYKITSLDLSNSQLEELPKVLKFLNLRDISHNKLAMIFICLYDLDVIENLDLSDNRITHFHVEPDCALNLKQMVPINNYIKNIPPGFLTFRCMGLELNYSENHAQYTFLNHRCNYSIRKLRHLILKNACLLDFDIFWLKSFRNLQLLDISNENVHINRKYRNEFKDLDKLFSKPLWKEIKILILNHLDISFFPNGIFWIESLTELHISNNLLSWFPDGIEYLVNLEVLDVSCNELIMMPKEICKLQKLKTFFAYKNRLEEIPPVPPHLEVLDLYDNYIKTIDSVNFKDVFIDLDYNFVSLEVQVFNYEKYCLIRDQFRNLYNFKDRFCKCKSPVSEYESSTNENLSSDLGSDNDKIVLCSGQYFEEDWDREYENCKLFKHPDITLSDHEYEGESEFYINKHCDSVTYVYDNNEDIIFEDAD